MTKSVEYVFVVFQWNIDDNFSANNLQSEETSPLDIYFTNRMGKPK